MKLLDEYTADRLTNVLIRIGAESILTHMVNGDVGVLRAIAQNQCNGYGIRPTVGNVVYQFVLIQEAGEEISEFGPCLLRNFIRQLEEMVR
jgi:hypothetical protein